MSNASLVEQLKKMFTFSDTQSMRYSKINNKSQPAYAAGLISRNKLSELYEKISEYQLNKMLDPEHTAMQYGDDYINYIFDKEFKALNITIKQTENESRLICYKMHRTFPDQLHH